MNFYGVPCVDPGHSITEFSFGDLTVAIRTNKRHHVEEEDSESVYNVSNKIPRYSETTAESTPLTVIPVTLPATTSARSTSASIDTVDYVKSENLRPMRIIEEFRTFEGLFEIFRLSSNPGIECIKGYGHMILHGQITKKNLTIHGIQLMPGYKIAHL